MVEIQIRDGDIQLVPLGWSRVWTLCRQLRFPLESVRAVTRAPSDVGKGIWKGWRLPGTHLPGVIVAGHYWRAGAWEFWDVRGEGRNAVVLELDGPRRWGKPYRRAVVDVADPEFVLAQLRSASPHLHPAIARTSDGVQYGGR